MYDGRKALIVKVLGIHASFDCKGHDPSVALIDDGKLTFAAEEERYLRYKTSSGRFPEYCLAACLEQTQTSFCEIDAIAYDGITSGSLGEKIRRYLQDLYGSCPPLIPVLHPDSHIYGAYFCSPFDDALVISIDGFGDGISIKVAEANGNKFLDIKSYGGVGQSLGDWYSAATNFLGFKSIEGEYKVMGMAGYARSNNVRYEGMIGFSASDESLYVDNNCFNYENYTSIYQPHYNGETFEKIAGHKPRGNGEITQTHFDTAGSIQNAFTKTYVELIEYFLKKTRKKNLVLTGGCSLNTLANLTLQKKLNMGERLFIYPAASDRGLSYGNAIKGYLEIYNDAYNSIEGNLLLRPTSMALGSGYSSERYLRAAERSGLPYRVFKAEDIAMETARILKDGQVIGVHYGRSEYGPRALGYRSILANAKIKGAKEKVNAKIKFRENYRPFAPALLQEDFLGLKGNFWVSPYMTQVFDVADHSDIFAETMHVDGTARVQTIDEVSSPFLHRVLISMKEFGETIPVLINTSFNLSGEPIVETPEDALRTFVGSELQSLVLGNIIVEKRSQAG